LTVPAHFTTHTGKDHWELLLRARAVENQCFVAAPAQFGTTLTDRPPSYGRSLIADPWGVVLACAPDEETVISAELDRARLEDVQRHPELEHDDEIWTAFTERIVRGMGGEGEPAAECARAIEQQWEEHHNFDLYEDVEPVFDVLRGHGLKIGLISNGARNLD